MVVWKGPLVGYVRNWGDWASSLGQVGRQPSALQDAEENTSRESCIPRAKTNFVCAATLPPSPRWSRVLKLRARAVLLLAFGEQSHTCVTRDRRRGAGTDGVQAMRPAASGPAVCGRTPLPAHPQRLHSPGGWCRSGAPGGSCTSHSPGCIPPSRSPGAPGRAPAAKCRVSGTAP